MDISTLYKCFTECSGVTTDSRNCPEGSMFIALKGETFNGNAFAAQALEKGCRYAVVDEEQYAGENPHILLVDNCLRTLQELANFHRRTLDTLIIGITGTNGKTTTTSLLGEIMKAYQPEVKVVGNIGTPYTSAALDTTDDTVTVAEISSFQLETIKEFHPAASAITNITEDHLNRHHTMEEYIRVKECITENQTMDDLCVLNYEDEILRPFGEKLMAEKKVQVMYFSSLRALKDGIYYQDGEIRIAKNGETELLTRTDDLKLLGLHNFENVMVASAMALHAGVPMETVRKVIQEFAGVEHRIEYVCEKDGVAYYNDSKGTNPDAAIKGIQAMNRPTLLIGGGYDKQSTYEEWIQAFDGKVRFLVLIGDTKEKIAKAARSVGFNDIIMADNLKEAVQICHDKANAGDAVLLSPACASWDQFKSYEQRGELFKEYVRAL